MILIVARSTYILGTEGFNSRSLDSNNLITSIIVSLLSFDPLMTRTTDSGAFTFDCQRNSLKVVERTGAFLFVSLNQDDGVSSLKATD
jgi:N-acetylmuramoyl-L-alanine amidase